jgi:hypothetical protein
MIEPGYIVRYRDCSPGEDSALIVEDERGDLYACTSQGLAVRIRPTHTTALLLRGWVAVRDARPQPLDDLLRTLRPVA